MIFPQFGRHVGHPQLLENLTFLLASDPQGRIPGLFAASEESVLIEPQASCDGPLAHHDIVFFRAGEIGQGEREFDIRHHPQIGLDAALQNHARLGFALSQNRLHAGLLDEKGDDRRRVLGGHQEVDVSDHFLPAPQTSGGRAAGDIRMSAQGLQDGIGANQGVDEAVARSELPFEGNGLEDFGLGLLTEPFQAGDGLSVAGRLQLLHRINSQLIVQAFHFLRPEALDFQQGWKSRWQRGLEFVEIGQGAGGDQAGDLVLERLTEALEFTEAVLGHELLQRLGQPLKNAGPIVVGSGLEGVLSLQLQQCTDLRQHRGDLVLVHAAG